MQILDKATDPVVDFLWSLRTTPVGRERLDLNVPFGTAVDGESYNERVMRLRVELQDAPVPTLFTGGNS